MAEKPGQDRGGRDQDGAGEAPLVQPHDLLKDGDDFGRNREFQHRVFRGEAQKGEVIARARAIKEVNPDYVIASHRDGEPLALSSFEDICYCGENLNTVFYSEGMAEKAAGTLPAGAPPYVTDCSNIPNAVFFADYLTKFGFIQAFMPQLTQWYPDWSQANGYPPDAEPVSDYDQAHPEVLTQGARGVLSRSLILGSLCWDFQMDHTVFKNMIVALQAFGGMRSARFINAAAASFIRLGVNDTQFPNNAPLYTCAHIKPGQVMLIVANWSSQPRTDTIDLNFKGLAAGITQITTLTDLEGNAPPPHNAASLSPTIGGNDYRIFMIQ